MSFGLIYRGNMIPLGQVPTVIGRSTSCKIMLDDSEVSRQHARIAVQEGELWIDALDSANGVFVNGDRIEGRCKLEAGDRIRIGTQDFRVGRLTERPHRAKRRRYQTPYGKEHARQASLDKLWDDEDSVVQPVVASTRRTSQLDLMGQAADESFSRKRPQDALRLLEPVLNELLARARKGNQRGPDEFDRAARYSIRLASALGHGRWIEYVFTLGAVLGKPLSPDRLDELQDAIGQVDSVSTEPLAAYRAKLEQGGAPGDDLHRALLDRLGAIEHELADEG
ncbi:MAG: FHA domain-containing protein [Deltaproteobacteria bacterium]|nr:FHA domain-containing protein [Deltaproteobacteria bacterium]MBW2536671.1 FHA domain-containing protein [Deltaproteobacteria bacterium]